MAANTLRAATMAATGSASMTRLTMAGATRQSSTTNLRTAVLPTSAHLSGLTNRQSHVVVTAMDSSHFLGGAQARRLSALTPHFSGNKRSFISGPRCMSSSAAQDVLQSKIISVGDTIPDVGLQYFDEEGVMQTINTGDLVKGKKVVIFAVPGAFTPTCSQKHLPAFIEKADELKAKGVDTIACVSVNDPFVMLAWGKSLDDAGDVGKILLLADGSGKFTSALGVELDLVDRGLGIRSRRYAMFIDDGVVKVFNLEEGGAFTNSGPEDILAAL